MAFLKNRSFIVKMANDKDLNSDGPLVEMDPMVGPQIAAAYAEVAKDFITHTALVVGGVFAACQIIKRICK